MISDVEIAQLSQAINLRLSYYETISFANILAESSIRYPVAEYLERRLSYKNIVLEYTNPTFKRRRCDLYVERKGQETIFEFKYVRDTTASLFQDYFDDILRLHYLHADGIQTLFVVCGSPVNFNSQFRTIKTRTTALVGKKGRASGPFSKVLSFSTNAPVITIDTNKHQSNYNEFCKHYEFRDTANSHPGAMSIQTRLIKLIHDWSQQSVGIWEVL